MKSFIRLLNCVVLVAMLAACGKDKSSGGSAAPKPVSDPLKDAASTTTNAKAAFDSFKSWYKSSADGKYPELGPGCYDETRLVSTNAPGSNCSEEPISIFGLDMGSFEFCNNFNSSGGDEIHTPVVVLGGAAKSYNLELKKIYEGGYGKLVGGEKNGTLYKLKFQTTDGVVREFHIETTIKSAFQPIKSIDHSAGSVEVLVDIQPGSCPI